MHHLLNPQLDDSLNHCNLDADLGCERALRVGAATLRRGAPNEMRATTVVCEVADSPRDVLERVLRQIEAEYGLDASIQEQPGSYCIRFTCRPPATTPETAPTTHTSLLARLLGR